jgi:hypothetical protein
MKKKGGVLKVMETMEGRRVLAFKWIKQALTGRLKMLEIPLGIGNLLI